MSLDEEEQRYFEFIRDWMPSPGENKLVPNDWLRRLAKYVPLDEVESIDLLGPSFKRPGSLELPVIRDRAWIQRFLRDLARAEMSYPYNPAVMTPDGVHFRFRDGRQSIFFLIVARHGERTLGPRLWRWLEPYVYEAW